MCSLCLNGGVCTLLCGSVFDRMPPRTSEYPEGYSAYLCSERLRYLTFCNDFCKKLLKFVEVCHYNLYHTQIFEVYAICMHMQILQFYGILQIYSIFQL